MDPRRAAVLALAVLIILGAALMVVRAENEKYHVDSPSSDVGFTVGDQLSEGGFPDGSV